MIASLTLEATVTMLSGIAVGLAVALASLARVGRARLTALAGMRE